MSMNSFCSSIVERDHGSTTPGVLRALILARPLQAERLSHPKMMLMLVASRPAAGCGKFIHAPPLAKWLRKVIFLAESGHHAIDAALFVDGKLTRG